MTLKYLTFNQALLAVGFGLVGAGLAGFRGWKRRARADDSASDWGE